jgi:hypothetical protein
LDKLIVATSETGEIPLAWYRPFYRESKEDRKRWLTFGELEKKFSIPRQEFAPGGALCARGVATIFDSTVTMSDCAVIRAVRFLRHEGRQVSLGEFVAMIEIGKRGAGRRRTNRKIRGEASILEASIPCH